jgi:23S rRNA (pseudouridine1915-N3)-methyltransferase
MKIKLLFTGKTGMDFVQEGIDEYLGRIKRFVTIEIMVLPVIKNAAKLSIPEIKEKEGKALLEKITRDDHVVLLDENGKQFDSRGFAQFLQKKMNASIKSLTFVFGGAYGFSDEACKMANCKLSLSRMTFTHQLVRIIFMEQLYRGLSIINGIPYHHD